MSLHGIGHMVEDHYGSERGNLLQPLHGIGHMVEDHYGSERGNLLQPLHGIGHMVEDIMVVREETCYSHYMASDTW